MPRQEYPFVRFKYPNGKIDKRGHTSLPIRISNPLNGQAVVTWGLLDTGADACLFPADLATYLGHDLKGNGVKSNVTSGIEQTSVPTYKHTFRIELLSPDRKKTIWTSQDLEIDCAESNPPVLLGVEDFLRHFKLTVDYGAERIVLEW